jgi:hypothetical protein
MRLRRGIGEREEVVAGPFAVCMILVMLSRVVVVV